MLTQSMHPLPHCLSVFHLYLSSLAAMSSLVLHWQAYISVLRFKKKSLFAHTVSVQAWRRTFNTHRHKHTLTDTNLSQSLSRTRFQKRGRQVGLWNGLSIFFSMSKSLGDRLDVTSLVHLPIWRWLRNEFALLLVHWSAYIAQGEPRCESKAS